MPQLAPAPWLATMLFSWLVFLIILQPKILSHLLPNEPASQDTREPKTATWNWPWP
uniref:ATP synthase complex subunit 8 n=1 Tax=Pennahia aneus TaxID=3051908 RepID=A0A888YUX1_9TELE|nr:ATP synthase F0 subunit 8 [Pennahia anea]